MNVLAAAARVVVPQAIAHPDLAKLLGARDWVDLGSPVPANTVITDHTDPGEISHLMRRLVPLLDEVSEDEEVAVVPQSHVLCMAVLPSHILAARGKVLAYFSPSERAPFYASFVFQALSRPGNHVMLNFYCTVEGRARS